MRSNCEVPELDEVIDLLNAIAFISGYVKPKSNLMKRTFLVLLLASQMMAFAQTQPVAPVKIVTDEYFGQKIDDPYQYMENMKDPNVIEWFKGQGDYSRSIMDHINGRDELIAKFKELDGRSGSRIYNLSITENDMYFYEKITPEDESGKLFFRIGFEGKEALLFDPDSYKPEDKVQYVIGTISPNSDGSKIGLSIAANGSESSILLVVNVDDKTLYQEEIHTCWGFSFAWLKDQNSFTYGKLNSDDVTDNNRQLNTKVYYHKMGEDVAKDKIIFSGEMFPELEITSEEIPVLFYDKDSDNIFCYASTVSRNQKIFLADGIDIGTKKLKWRKIVAREDQIETFYTDKENFYFRTPKGAPNYKIMMTPLDNTDFQKATVLVEENKNEVLKSFTITSKGYYYTSVKAGVEAKVYHLSKDGEKVQELDLPFPAGSARLQSKDVNHEDVWISINGWTRKNERFRYLPDSKEFKDELLSSKVLFPEFDGFEVEEVMVTSHDGVKVPLSIIYKKGMNRDGEAPLMLYGYGSYGISINPFFSPMFLTWVGEGGVIAIAHVRGGGELGDQWHKAGFKETKPNTWKDFIASAEYLHKEKFSSPGKTTIFGGSAGGILVGRAMTSRPDLFAVAVPAVGVMNALRTELEPNGPVNVPEFGSFKVESEFKALVEMDAYLKLKDGVEYPATMVTAGINDPRVIAWQPGKFAARLQAANASDNPILFRVDYESGHGSDSKTKTFEEFADIFSFAFWQTGHPSYQSIKTKDGQLAK